MCKAPHFKDAGEPQIMDEYRKKHPFTDSLGASHTFEMLEQLDDQAVKDLESNDITICGFITSTRPYKGGVFYSLADPYLRKTLQLVSPWDQVYASKPQQNQQSSLSDEGTVEDAVENTQGIRKDTKHEIKIAHNSVSLHDNIDHNEDEQTKASSVGDEDIEGPSSESAEQRVPIKRVIGGVAPHVPVVVVGQLLRREVLAKTKPSIQNPKHTEKISRPQVHVVDPFVGKMRLLADLELRIKSISPLNTFPKTLAAKFGTNFPPQKRHLEFRTNDDLRKTIRHRSKAVTEVRKFMFVKGFDEIETPLLFKSTPEGAREFMVPTRSKGMAYALPQSPQQYKQILMASGFARYFQLAKCFRDEDMRADRQPEFTQLDMEMSFATSHDVMRITERLLVQTLWPLFTQTYPYEGNLKKEPPFTSTHVPPDLPALFPIMSYDFAMRRYGSDKPDLRLGSRIFVVHDFVPESLVGMLSPLKKPIVEICRIRMDGAEPSISDDFIKDLLGQPSMSKFLDNPAGPPGVTVFDPAKPLEGLASFGMEAAEKVKSLTGAEPGDIFILQARESMKRFSGSSTPLGDLRREIHLAAIMKGIKNPPTEKHCFLWVVDFPLFMPVSEAEPGQGGAAGIRSTHHPFTAPKDDNLAPLFRNPLAAVGDHYDLVINGVEIGGGSRRIHNAGVQELILRDVLKMKPERVEDFRHLLDALAAGCPPHAGIALGFDRLLALLLNKSSIRDVIAFPKWADAEDKMVGAPSSMTDEQLRTYHLNIRD